MRNHHPSVLLNQFFCKTMKKAIFLVFLIPMGLVAQLTPIIISPGPGTPSPGFTWSNPIYDYDAVGNRIARYRIKYYNNPLREELSEKWEISLKPNPSDGLFILHSNVPLAGQDLHIYDINGRTILRDKLEGSSTKIDLRQQASGIYIFRVRNGTEFREVKGFLKE